MTSELLLSQSTRKVRLGPTTGAVERRTDGIEIVRAQQQLEPYPQKLTERLEHWARVAPERAFLSQRDASGAWRSLTYAQSLSKARRIARALIARNLSADKPVVILSSNDLEHALLGFGAMIAGVPFAPISVPYSLISADFSKLKYILELLTPGLVFAACGQQFARALRDVVNHSVEIVVTRNATALPKATLFEDLLSNDADASVDAAHVKVSPDTIVKILFSSGSTGLPKGVINTHRMLCSNQQMLLQMLPFLSEEPPIICDWLPWNHTFGGNHNVGIALYNGGTLYIDDGKPVLGQFDKSLRNISEIEPTVFFNVPKGFELIAQALRKDATFRQHFFKRVKILFYAGAGLPQPVWDALQEQAEIATGQRIPIITGLGCTEAAPTATLAARDDGRAGFIGLPCPGLELKLAPSGHKMEVRYRGPNITPGYWRRPELNAKAFDDEGFYCTGDAARWVDPNNIQAGLLFDGRIAEDFKLTSGTWVSVGPLRTKLITRMAPWVRDVVIAGHDRDEVGVLIFPDMEECRSLCNGLTSTQDSLAVLRHPNVLKHIRGLLKDIANEATGSSNRVTRAVLLEDAPSLDVGEITDKGSLNSSAVLRHRAALVEQLYQHDPPAQVILISASL
jgi:feruloyl-CoA synthase